MSAPAAVGRRGRLKVYLGFAAGVGKTYQMLVEAQELKAAGVDVVIGYFEPHGRADTIAQTAGLETLPRQVMEYRGSRLEEMDTAAILARRPAVCLVDEFPHTNVPGSPREKRWQDVLALRDAGIDVLTTMNIQHLDSLNEQVFQLTGVRVRETVPDWVVAEAGEVVMVDLTPRALLNRLERGVVYPPEKARLAMQNFFRESTLTALREMALRQTAHEVDVRKEESGPAEPSGRILVHVTDEPSSAALIRRARRVADYLQADCLAAAVTADGTIGSVAGEKRSRLEQHLNFARNLRIETHVLAGERVAETLVSFARSRQVTQLFVAQSRVSSRLSLFRRSIPQEVVRLAQDLRVVVVAAR